MGTCDRPPLQVLALHRRQYVGHHLLFISFSLFLAHIFIFFLPSLFSPSLKTVLKEEMAKGTIHDARNIL